MLGSPMSHKRVYASATRYGEIRDCFRDEDAPHLLRSCGLRADSCARDRRGSAYFFAVVFVGENAFRA